MPELLIHTAVNQNQPTFPTCFQNEFFNLSTVHLSTTQYSNCEGCWKLLYLHIHNSDEWGDKSSDCYFKPARALYSFQPEGSNQNRYRYKNIIRSQEFDFSMCHTQCWATKSFNTLIVKSFIFFQYSSGTINCFKMPAVYLALKHFRYFCLSIPHDCLALIALKNDLSGEGRGMLIWQFTGSIKDFNCTR